MNIELIVILVWLCAISITLLIVHFSKKNTLIVGELFVNKEQSNSGSNPCKYSSDTISMIDIADIDNNLFISK